MLKKLLLSTVFALSTLATATQINLGLELTITHEENKQTATGEVIISENEVTSVVFNGLESLIIDVLVQPVNDTLIIQARFFQKGETDELLPIIDWLAVQVPYDQPATFTINEAEGDGTLVLVVTPSLVD